jgi:hypothetical protein
MTWTITKMTTSAYANHPAGHTLFVMRHPELIDRRTAFQWSLMLHLNDGTDVPVVCRQSAPLTTPREKSSPVEALAVLADFLDNDGQVMAHSFLDDPDRPETTFPTQVALWAVHHQELLDELKDTLKEKTS